MTQVANRNEKFVVSINYYPSGLLSSKVKQQWERGIRNG